MNRVILLMVLLLSSGIVSAQDSVWVPDKNERWFGVFGSFVKVTSDFRSDEGESAGAAKNGFGGGLMFYSPLRHSPTMSLGFEARLTMNPIGNSPLEDILENVEVKGTYTNVWLLGGIILDINNALSVKGLAGVVMADFPEIEQDNGFGKFKIDIATESVFGYGVGGTIWIAPSSFIDVTYLVCEPGFEIQYNSSTPNSKTVKVGHDESMVAISLGFAF